MPTIVILVAFLLLFASFFLWIAGTMFPKITQFIFRKVPTRKRVFTVFGLSTFGLFILCIVVIPRVDIPPSQTVASASKQPTVTPPQKINVVVASVQPTPAPVVEKTKTEPIPAKTETKNTPSPIPTPTPAPQTDNQNTSPVSSETVSQKNAVAKAKSYLGYTAFSHDGLVAQLEYDQFSHADAVYGSDNSGANWNEQAAAKAKSYMSYSSFSRGSLIAQLEYDKFTQVQAEYGANAVGL